MRMNADVASEVTAIDRVDSSIMNAERKSMFRDMYGISIGVDCGGENYKRVDVRTYKKA